jgi:paraquat-inducible protein B
MRTARPAVVGGFVLGALALAVGAILFFGGTRVLAPTVRAVVFFEGSVAGLEMGAPVTFRGVRVGSVQRMALHLASDGRARIPVTIELFPGQVSIEGEEMRREASVERFVAAGLRAQLNLQSFVTGQLRIDLDFRPGTPAALVTMDTGDLPQIPALPSDLDRLRETLSDVPVQDLAQTMQRVLQSAERLAVTLEDELGPLLNSARRGVDTATHTLETTEAAVIRLQNDASVMLHEVATLAADARRQVDVRGDELGRTLATVDRAARQAETLLAALNGMAAPRAPFRSDLEATLRDLAASAASLRGFTRQVERDPSALLTGRTGR